MLRKNRNDFLGSVAYVETHSFYLEPKIFTSIQAKFFKKPGKLGFINIDFSVQIPPSAFLSLSSPRKPHKIVVSEGFFDWEQVFEYNIQVVFKNNTYVRIIIHIKLL